MLVPVLVMVMHAMAKLQFPRWWKLSKTITITITKKNKNFVSSEESGIMPEFIGEVVISSPQAEQQATEKGISFMEEVAFLLAHGILHLLGRDQ